MSASRQTSSGARRRSPMSHPRPPWGGLEAGRLAPTIMNTIVEFIVDTLICPIPFALYWRSTRRRCAASETEQGSGAIREPTRSETSHCARGLSLRNASAGSAVVQNRQGHGQGVHHRRPVTDGLLLWIDSRFDRRSGKPPAAHVEKIHA